MVSLIKGLIDFRVGGGGGEIHGYYWPLTFSSCQICCLVKVDYVQKFVILA